MSSARADAECIFIAGMRGSGKSTRVQHLIGQAPRVVCFDPTGQYGRPPRARGYGWPVAATLPELHATVSPRWHGPPWRAALIVAGDFELELHKLSVYLWHAQAPYESGRDRKKLTLIVEEMDLAVPNHATPKGLGGFKRLVLQGRHRGVEVIGVTQHPALVPTWFRINCAERYLFALGVEDHAVMGTRYRDELARLTPHRFIRFADGAATSGGNPPLGSAADGGSRSGAGAPAPHQVKPTKGGKTTVPWRR